MTRSGYQLWTSDMVIGAAILITGIVATLVRMNILIVKWSVELPPVVIHLWPLLLILGGAFLVLDRADSGAGRRRSNISNGAGQ